MERIPLNPPDESEVNYSTSQMSNVRHRETKLHAAASAGQLEKVKELCRTEPHLINEGDEVDGGETPLHKAARHGHASVLLHLLSHAKQKITCDTRKQTPLDVAVKQDNDDVAMAIAGHPRWKEFLHHVDEGDSQLQQMIIKMPEVAHKFLDNCIHTTKDLEGESDSKVTYDFRFLQGMPEFSQDNPRFFLHSLQTMVEYKRLGCLTHPLCQALLHWKWKKFGWWLFAVNLLLYMIFLGCLTTVTIWLDSRRYLRNPELMIIPNSFIILLCIVQFLKEIFQIWEEKLKYFKKFDNWLEWLLYGDSLAVAIGHIVRYHEEKPSVGMRATAAVAVFLAWINFVLYMQRSTFFGTYVIMMKTIIKTILKLVMLFLPFIIAFGVPFYLLFPKKLKPDIPGSQNVTVLSGDSTALSHPYIFDGIGYSLHTTFMLLLGEMRYVHTVYKYQPINYPWISYPLFVIFALCMPVVIKNLLIGLSVGDVKKILESAKMEHHKLQVQLLLELEKSLPCRLLNRFKVAEWTDYPYRQKTWLQKLAGLGTRMKFCTPPTAVNKSSKEVSKLNDTVARLSEQVEKQEERETKLHEAASSGQLEKIKELCRTHLHLINEDDDGGETALLSVARHGHATVLLHLLSNAQQKVIHNKNKQTPLDVAVKQDNDEIAMVIAGHPRWKEFLHRVDEGESQLQSMVIKMPEIAQRFLDNCVQTKTLFAGETTAGVTYDFRFLQGMPELDRDNPRFFLNSFKTMVEYKRLGCLTHPLYQAMLRCKWSRFGWWLFGLNLLVYMVFLGCLTAVAICLDDIRYMRNPEVLEFPNTVVILLCAVQFLKEIFQIWEEKLKYFTKFDNWLERCLYGLSLSVAVAHKMRHQDEDPTVGMRAVSAAAVFMAWINFVLYMQQSTFFGVYVIMMKTIIKTLLKLVTLFLPFVVAFGVPFFLLFPNKPKPVFPGSQNITVLSGDSTASSHPYIFDGIGYSLHTTFMLLLGEMRYVHTVYKYQPINYPWLSYPLFVIFALCMPIVIKNLLIGLSVGDVIRILERAKMEHFKLQLASFGADMKFFTATRAANCSSQDIARLKEAVLHLSDQVEKQEEKMQSIISLLTELRTHVIASKLIEKADTRPCAGSTEALGVVPGVGFVSEETNF